MKRLFILLLIVVPMSLGLFSMALAQNQVNGNNSIVSDKLIFPLVDQHVHSSCFVELPNGDFLVVWFQGSGERTANDVQVMGARLKKGASQWSKPFPMADTPGLPDCNPVIFLNNSGKLFLVWIAVLADRWESSILRVRTSVDYNNDGAPVWNWQDNIFFKPGEEFPNEFEAKKDLIIKPESEPVERFQKLKDHILEMSHNFGDRSIGWMTRIHPIILENGRILLPLYSDGLHTSMVAISDDDGQTWRSSLPIIGLGIQPTLSVRKNGDIVAFMRNAAGEPDTIWRSLSKDNGESWEGGTKTDMPAIASVELDVLKDGRWIYVATDVETGRYRISLYVSHDEGKTWHYGETLVYDPEKRDRYSYPCVRQTKDGMINVTFSCHLHSVGEKRCSIKHVTIDPAKLP